MLNFSAKTDKASAKIRLNYDKITPDDRIVFSDAFFYHEQATGVIAIYGTLGEGCNGISDYKNKDWKPAGEKVLLTVCKTKKQQWDEATRKFVEVSVTQSEAYLYARLAADLNTMDANSAISLVCEPYVAPMFFDFLDKLGSVADEATRKAQEGMLEAMVQKTVVLGIVPETKLTDEDRTTLTKANSSSYGGYGGSKGETEAEKLSARWKFMQSELLKAGYQFETMYDLCCAIGEKKEGEELNRQTALSNTVKLITQFF